MPRIREVKPEFFLDEQLAELSHAARLLFIGLWTLCDREGRLEDRPARIKAQVFPYGSEDVDSLLDELAGHQGAFLKRYELESRRFLEVRSFRKHQRPHPKETPSRLPAPSSSMGAVKSSGLPGKETASRESPTCQVDPSGGSMGTWAHGSMGHGSMGGGKVGSGEDEEPPTLPPADRTEKAIRLSTDALRTKLYTLVDEAVRLDPKGRDPTELMRLFTAYTKSNGQSVRGVVNASMLNHERLEKSIADAETQITEWRANGARQGEAEGHGSDGLSVPGRAGR